VTVAPAGLVAGVVMLAGTVIVGGVVSWTVTVNVALLELGGVAWSLALQVTVVAPIGNVEPEAGAQDRLGLGSTRSVALAE
jgi:hypothetical protein